MCVSWDAAYMHGDGVGWPSRDAIRVGCITSVIAMGGKRGRRNTPLSSTSLTTRYLHIPASQHCNIARAATRRAPRIVSQEKLLLGLMRKLSGSPSRFRT